MAKIYQVKNDGFWHTEPGFADSNWVVVCNKKILFQFGQCNHPNNLDLTFTGSKKEVKDFLSKIFWYKPEF